MSQIQTYQHNSSALIHPFNSTVNLLKNKLPTNEQFTQYKTYLDTYKSDQAEWESNTAKKIMRSIGCHRLRDPNNDAYGWWNESDGGKCSYQPKVINTTTTPSS